MSGIFFCTFTILDASNMFFQDFLQVLPKVEQVIFPADVAHQKMMPSNRMELLKAVDFEKVNPKKAAVMMLFYPKHDQTHLVLIHRTSYYGVHSSQIAFPGGKPEREDNSLEQTALRETYEEVGIHPNEINIIRPFTQVYIPPSNFMVFPFLGISQNELLFKKQEDEVGGIIELPLPTFLDDSIVEQRKMATSYAGSIDVPGFVVENHFVWGATAMILSELKETIKMAL
jgi:8-oxo-dGTP pyrophosphatase MutT (NUDIX family)